MQLNCVKCVEWILCLTSIHVVIVVISEHSSTFHGGDLSGDLPVRSASHPEVRPTQYVQGTLTGEIHGVNECVITSFFLLTLTRNISLG